MTGEAELHFKLSCAYQFNQEPEPALEQVTQVILNVDSTLAPLALLLALLLALPPPLSPPLLLGQRGSPPSAMSFSHVPSLT